jgi:hypothetical protein
LWAVGGGAEGPGNPDAKVKFVGTKGGANMLGKDVGTCPAPDDDENNEEVGGTNVVACP